MVSTIASRVAQGAVERVSARESKLSFATLADREVGVAARAVAETETIDAKQMGSRTNNQYAIVAYWYDHARDKNIQ